MDEEFSIGYWIKRRRKSLYLTQKDLANLVGCALITIAKIEADQRRPSREIAALLAKHLQISTEQTGLFINILRGEKSSSQLQKLTLPIQNISASQTFEKNSALGLDELRGVNLIQRISRGKLVGRRIELAAALNEWNAVRTGEGKTLIFHGEPGIGKSRIALELIHEAKQQNAIILVGECFSGGERPYAPFSRIIQNINDFPEEFPPVAIADLKTIAPQLEARFPNIKPNPKLEPFAEQMRLFESIYMLFNLMARKSPLLILIEDIHWADHGSLELINNLAHRFQRAGLSALTILTAREEASTKTADLSTLFDDLLRAHISTSIHLNRFNEEETHELLTSIFGQQVTGEFVELIHRETSGNPFFIEEVCKELIENGTIYWLNGQWERKEIKEIQVPKSVQNAIQSRLNKLPKETQDILLMAAILGRRFDFDLLHTALACEENSLIEVLETAKHSQIIVDVNNQNGGTFEFSHNLISTVLLENASAPRRRILHKKAIEALEQIHPAEYNQLAHHYRETGNQTGARINFHKAAERAMQVYAHEDAVRFYTEALSLATDQPAEACRLLLMRERVYDLRGQRTLQAQDLSEAMSKAEAANDPSLRAEVELVYAEYTIQTREQVKFIEHVKNCIELAKQAQNPITQASAYMLWGRMLSETGELVEAREKLMLAGDLGREAGLLLIEARSNINIGTVHYRLGEYEAAREKYTQSLETIRVLGERRIECMTLNNLGNVTWATGNLNEALTLYQQALSIAREIGDTLNEARTLGNIGSILTEQFQYAEALPNLEQAIILIRDLGQRGDEVTALSHLGDIMEALGRYSDALMQKEQSMQIAREIDDVQGEAEALYGLSHINLSMENFTEAEELAQKAIALAKESNLPAEEAEAWNMLAKACFAQQNWNKTIEACETALKLYLEMGLEQKCAEMRAYLARAAELNNDHAQALDHLSHILPDRSPETIHRIKDPSLCLSCYLILQQEDPAAATSLLKNGHDTLQEMLAKINNANAREHYLKHIANHKLLAELWREHSA